MTNVLVENVKELVGFIVLCVDEGLDNSIVCLSFIVSVTTGRKLLIFNIKYHIHIDYLIIHVSMMMKEKAYGKRWWERGKS